MRRVTAVPLEARVIEDQEVHGNTVPGPRSPRNGAALLTPRFEGC
jgi:hypothetical protein